MIKKRHCKYLALLLSVFALTGCLGSTVSTYRPRPGGIIQNIKVPTIPPSLTDELSTSIATLNYDSSQWGVSGAYTVIPQTAINYNQYIEGTINGLLTIMVAVKPDDQELQIGRYLTTIKYENINHVVYDRKLTFYNDSTNQIEAIFYANKEGTHLNLVIRFRGDEHEFREVLFEDLGGEKHAIVLYYRRDAMQENKVADMNGIVEVWETSDTKQIKDVRVYGLSEPDSQHIVNFAAFSYKNPLSPTTARYYRSKNGLEDLGEILDSPAIFNEQDKYVRSIEASEIVKGYPTVEEATAVYNRGIDHRVVRDAVIDIYTLESNLFDLVF